MVFLLQLCRLLGLVFRDLLLVGEQGLLHRPQLRIQPRAIDQLFVRAAFRDAALLEADDKIRVVDGAQTVSHEDGSALLFLDDGVDVREQGLLGVRVQR